MSSNERTYFAARAEKAKKIFPRPTAGPLRPIVHGQTIKYNLKRRLGRGFTFEELKVLLTAGCHPYDQLVHKADHPVVYARYLYRRYGTDHRHAYGSMCVQDTCNF